MAEELIGKVNHWFGKINVAGIELTDDLAVGDHIHFLGHTTDFEQEVTSMQILHQNVKQATCSDSVGVKVRFRVRPGDHVYKVT